MFCYLCLAIHVLLYMFCYICFATYALLLMFCYISLAMYVLLRAFCYICFATYVGLFKFWSRRWNRQEGPVWVVRQEATTPFDRKVGGQPIWAWFLGFLSSRSSQEFVLMRAPMACLAGRQQPRTLISMDVGKRVIEGSIFEKRFLSRSLRHPTT